MKVRKFQVGGSAAPAPTEGAQQAGPEEQLMAMANELIQNLGPEAAAMLAQMIMEMLQGAAAPQEAPVYARKGGRLVMRGRR